MQCVYREICSLKKILEENYIEKEKNRLCGGQGIRTLEKEHRTIGEDKGYVTNFIRTITPEILDRFQRSKWPPKALKKTFQTVPKTSQSNQYSLSHQQISQ